MAFGRKLLAGFTSAGLVALIAVPAHAGLLGSGKTVQATFTSFGPQVSPYIAVTPVDPANAIAPQPLTTPQQFTEATSDTLLTVGDTQVSIDSLFNPPAPFCFSTNGLSGASCPDPEATVTFMFTGENITSATIDPASAAIFLTPPNPRQGITFGPNEIAVNVVGANPPANGTLIIDVVTGGTGPTPMPEPESIATLAVALSGIFAARRRRRKQG